MDPSVKEKLQRLAEELKDLMVNPDVEVEVHFGDEEERKFPFVRVRYTTEEHEVHEKDIEIAEDNLNKSVEELKEYVTFMIEQFMEEIDSVEYGGE